MKIDQILVTNDTSIKETMKIIDRGSIRTAIVVDESKRLIGVVTDGDIRRGILSGIDINEQVSKIMNDNPFFVKSSTSKEEIITTLKEKGILNAPVVDENKNVIDIVLLSGGSGTSNFNKSERLNKHLGTILVIGGAGYVGSILVRKLLSKGYRVNVLDKFLYGKESLQDIKENQKLRIVEGDTRHIEDITSAIREADAVVHLAELVGDPACALDTTKTTEINCLATRAIASICKHFQINRLVYASSCSVYGASEGGALLTEESPLTPVSLYAKMKIASEKALLEMRDDNFLPTILRLGTVFGFSYRPRFDLVVNLLTAKAIKEGKITIFGGDQWRPNVHVEDVADTIVSVLESPIEDVGGKIFNVGHEDNNHTINKIGDYVKELIPSAEVVIEDKEVDKRDYKVDFTKIREILGDNIKKNLGDGINEIRVALEQDQELDYCDKKHSNIKFLTENNPN
ncbi:NAD-dependent epimerase/dehydratase family protein [Candidatus Woesearchaeota archaeon]|nr:NAD-dependent epimerase/dehydratase family protein [Candidatus Woesearchaeota archaeon]